MDPVGHFHQILMSEVVIHLCPYLFFLKIQLDCTSMLSQVCMKLYITFEYFCKSLKRVSEKNLPANQSLVQEKRVYKIETNHVHQSNHRSLLLATWTSNALKKIFHYIGTEMFCNVQFTKAFQYRRSVMRRRSLLQDQYNGEHSCGMGATMISISLSVRNVKG